MSFHASAPYFMNNQHSNVTFIVEGQSIPGHIMLLENCPYFKTIPFGATVELNNVSYKIFVEILRCVYQGKVDLNGWTSDEVKQLLQIADEYEYHAMAFALAEAVNVYRQIPEILEDVVGVAIRLNCVPLLEKCAYSVKGYADKLLRDQTAFDRLPMELICHLIEKGVWHRADARLVFAIANWRKTASVEDKKRLLSKIDWKSLPGKFSEPLVRMFLENDADRLQSKDWTSGLDVRNYCPAATYLSYGKKLWNQGFPPYTVVIDNQSRNEHVIIFFREQVTRVKEFKFDFECNAEISLTIYEAERTTKINGTYDDDERSKTWHFEIPSNVQFSSALLEITNLEFGDKSFKKTKSHYISGFKLCFY